MENTEKSGIIEISFRECMPGEIYMQDSFSERILCY